MTKFEPKSSRLSAIAVTILVSLALLLPVSAIAKLDYCEDGADLAMKSPFKNSVGLILADVPGKGTLVGTGFKVGDNLILTARHVVTQGSGALRKKMETIRYIPGIEVIHENEIWRTDIPNLDVEIISQGGFSEDGSNDWALLRIKKATTSIQEYANQIFSESLIIPNVQYSGVEKFEQIESIGYSSKCWVNGIIKMVAFKGNIAKSESIGYSAIQRFSLWLRGIEGAANLPGGGPGMSGAPILSNDGAIGILTNGEENLSFFSYSSNYIHGIGRPKN